MPVWHASVAVQGFRGPVLYGLLDPRTQHVMQETALGLIADVGTGEVRRDRSDRVLHARKRLSDLELAGQSCEWHAIQAIDSAGGGMPW